MNQPLLTINNLRVALSSSHNSPKILHGISFTINRGEIVGLIGESGCGKSMTASSILGLLPPTLKAKGEILFENKNLLSLPLNALNQLRGTKLSLILQDPSLALNPLIKIGKQLTEGLRIHQKLSKQEAQLTGIHWLEKVGINNAALRMNQYPHEISGGMKQRILIAIALICSPSLVIADEPTTALDLTTQAQILELMHQLQIEKQIGLLFITHDLGIVAKYCQKVIVMYAGQIVESGPVSHIFNSPQHPYTQALLRAKQALFQTKGAPLFFLEGIPPRPTHSFKGCAFAPRCNSAMEICKNSTPARFINHCSTLNTEVLCWLKKANEEL